MKTDTRNKILRFIADNEEVSAGQIINYLKLSPQAVHRQLKKLLESNKISKAGTPPKVFYQINRIEEYYKPHMVMDRAGYEAGVVEDNFIYVSPFGKILWGIDGFVEWCRKQGLDYLKTAAEYQKTILKYNKYKKDGFIDGMHKMNSSFDKVFLDKIYYLDFYSIERFGKTKLGMLVLYAKQSQSKVLIDEVAGLTKDRIKTLIKREKIDAVCYVPHTIPRKVQFLKELSKQLDLPLSQIDIVKAVNEIPVAQKTLKRIEDRIENARNTIFVTEKRQFNNILIIDDAVGSGATMNETARKLKSQGIVKGKVMGLALTGSFKGFEVFNEI